MVKETNIVHKENGLMYERSIINLPFPPTSSITTEKVREIMAIKDFQITHSDKDISWIELAIKNLEYMIQFSSSLGGSTAEMQIQKLELESSLNKTK